MHLEDAKWDVVSLAANHHNLRLLMIYMGRWIINFGEQAQKLKKTKIAEQIGLVVTQFGQ